MTTAVSTEVAGSLRDRATREYERELEAAQAKRLAERNKRANENLSGFRTWMRDTLGIHEPVSVTVSDDGDRVEALVDGDVALFYAVNYDADYGYESQMGVVIQCAKCRAPLYMVARDVVGIGQALSEPFEHGDYRSLPRRFGMPMSCEGGVLVVSDVPEPTQSPSVEHTLVQALRNFLNDWMDSR